MDINIEKINSGLLNFTTFAVNIGKGKNVELIKKIIDDSDVDWEEKIMNEIADCQTVGEAVEKADGLLVHHHEIKCEDLVIDYIRSDSKINPKYIKLKYCPGGYVAYQPPFQWEVTESEKNLSKEDLLDLLGKVAELFQVA